MMYDLCFVYEEAYRKHWPWTVREVIRHCVEAEEKSFHQAHSYVTTYYLIVRSAERYDDLALLAVSARPISRVRILPE